MINMFLLIVQISCCSDEGSEVIQQGDLIKSDPASLTVMDRRHVVIIGYCNNLHNLVIGKALEYRHYPCVPFSQRNASVVGVFK